MHTIIELDKSLFLFLNTASWLRADAFWIFMSSHISWLLFCLPAAILLTVKLRLRLFERLLWIGLLFLITDQSANFFKKNVQRPRPCREEALMAEMNFINGRCSAYGYFSGHAANSMGLAVFTALSLSACWPRRLKPAWWAFALLFAVTVSLSRIMVGVHYPLDILSGWLWGAMWALLLHRALIPFLYKKMRITS